MDARMHTFLHSLVKEYKNKFNKGRETLFMTIFLKEEMGLGQRFLNDFHDY